MQICYTDYRQLWNCIQLKKTGCSVNLCFAGFFHWLWQHSSRCMQQPERAAGWPPVSAIPGWYTMRGTTGLNNNLHFFNTNTNCNRLFQAHEFEVVGMRPSAQSIILGNQWSSRARDRFITLVKGHSLIASLYSILHGVMRVHLLITSETDNTNVVDIMVQEGHAVKAEESFDSKVGVKSSAFSMSWKSKRECTVSVEQMNRWPEIIL